MVNHRSPKPELPVRAWAPVPINKKYVYSNIHATTKNHRLRQKRLCGVKADRLDEAKIGSQEYWNCSTDGYSAGPIFGSDGQDRCGVKKFNIFAGINYKHG